MKKTKLTRFEEDSIWMSYRYCIGRSTIAAFQRAGDILKFIKEKDVNDAWLQHTATDINRQIEDILYVTFNWDMPQRLENGSYRPFMQFIKDNADVSLEQWNMFYNTLNDLKTWADLAAWMDKRTHSIAHMSENGKAKDVEYFTSYHFTVNEDGNLECEPVKIPVDGFDAIRAVYLNEDAIVSVDY